MSRNFRIVVAALVFGAAAAGSSVVAGPAAIARAAASPDDADDARANLKATNAGTLSGTVTKIDYQKSRLSVQTAHGSVDVTVLPSTTIQGRDGFSGISDIAKGQHVTIFLSQKGDEKFAQIIQLQK